MAIRPGPARKRKERFRNLPEMAHGTLRSWEPWCGELVTSPLVSEPWCSESVTLPLALGSLGAPSFLCHRSLLGALVLSACLRDRSLLVAAVFRDVYVAARSWEPCPLAVGSHGVIWRLWGFWGVCWGSFGGHIRALLDRLGALLGCLGTLLGRLGASWRPLAVLGLSWGPLGSLLGPSWGSPGAVLRPSWAVLGPSWAVFGPSWAVLGPSWGPLGQSWDDLWGLLGRLGPFLARKAEHPKNIQNPMENQ